MPRKTLKTLEMQLDAANQECNRLHQQVAQQEIALKFYKAIDQHFHMLLSGVVGGLKEGTFPRRSNA